MIGFPSFFTFICVTLVAATPIVQSFMESIF